MKPAVNPLTPGRSLFNKGSSKAIVLWVFQLAATSIWALDSSLPPGGNFDLSHWYLQLPTSNNILTGASGSVDSITTASLVAGATNAYFYTGSDGAMSFWVPDNGAHTGGSAHPRSELRELANINDSSVNWTLYGSNVMTAQCKVLQVPADTQKVCIGQIHEPTTMPDGSAGANNEQMIMFDLGNQIIYANVNLDGDTNASFSTVFISGTGVATNKTINYTMSVVNGLLKIIVNNVTNSWNLFSGTNYLGHIAQNWDRASSNTVYFKAGDYNQTLNTCNCSTDGARVAFYSLNLFHSPVISGQPTNVVVQAGSNATFSVSATTSGILNYQWLFNGTNSLSGMTNATLALTNVSAANVGSYSVIVGDSVIAYNSVTSSVATLTGFFPPIIIGQPNNQSATIGSNVTFAVSAIGTPPLTYSWWFNTNNFIASSTNTNLTLANILPANAGQYLVLVSNAYGSVTSSVATLAIIDYVSSTNLYLDDLWLDGSRTNTSPPTDSAWYASSPATLYATTNGLTGLPPNATNATAYWWTYFTTNPASPAQLKVGDTLRVTLTFTASGINPTNGQKGLRFGLCNTSASTRTLADSSLPNGTNVTGYLLNMNFGQIFGGSPTMQFLERTNLPDSNLISTVTDYFSLGSGGPANSSAGFSNNTPYGFQFSVKRNSNSMDLTATFTNNAGWNAVCTATDTNTFASPTAFDTFAVRCATNGQTATNFSITEFKVELMATNNHPPVFGSNSVSTIMNKPASFTVSSLLANASDPDGDAISLTAINNASTNNGTVALANGIITYSPPTNFIGSDLLNYTLTDARGATSAGCVFLTIESAIKINSVFLTSTAIQIQAAGLPAGSNFTILAKSNLNDTVWLPIATNAANISGNFIFTETNAARHFFRLQYP
jgi:Alginate lyase/Bacterial Ig domain/Immunoglobulin domain